MVTIPKKIYDEMIKHAKTCYPQEACGLLGGTQGLAKKFYPTRNVDQSSVSYTIDPKEQIRVFKQLSADKLDLLAIFHSHVASSAEPSHKDKDFATYPEVSYLIVSLADMNAPVLKSFKIQNGQATEEALKVE